MNDDYGDYSAALPQEQDKGAADYGDYGVALKDKDNEFGEYSAAIKKPSPTPATDKAASETAKVASRKAQDERLKSFGVDTAAPESFFDPASKSAQIAEGVAQDVVAMVPKSPLDIAKMFTYSPLWDIPAQLRQSYQDIIRGPVMNAPPSGPYAGFTQMPLTQQAKLVAEPIVQTAPALFGLREAAIRGGVTDASKITKSASVPQPEVRTQLGETPRVRQPGETPQAQAEETAETPQVGAGAQRILTQQQGGEVIDEKAQTPGQVGQGIREVVAPGGEAPNVGDEPTGVLPGQGTPETVAQQPRGKDREINLGEGQQAGEQLGDSGKVLLSGEGEGKTPPPSSAVFDEPHVSAIANKFVAERSARGEIGQVTPGRGFSRDDLVYQGLKMPPEEINQHVSDLMQGTGDIVKQGQAVRAEEARLSQRSSQLSQIAENQPKNVEAKMAADNAFKDLEDFHNGPVATLKNKWHATGLEMQGEIPVDLSTFNGLRTQWMKDTGKAPSPKIETELRRTAQNVSKAVQEDNGARSNLAQAIEKESTRKKYPTADEVRNNIRERMGLEPCKT